MAIKKLRILFDAQPMVGSKTGVGVYTVGLIKALAAAEPEKIELVGHYFNFLGRQAIELPTAPNISYVCSRFMPKQVVNLLRRFGINLPFELLIRKRGDFLLFPSFLDRPSFFGTPMAPVVHDVTYLDHPEYVDTRNQHDLERHMPATLRRARFVLTVSHTTEIALKRHYPHYDRPIIVEPLPPGIQPVDAKTKQTTLTRYGITKPYIVFLSTLEPRKNVDGLLAAYQLLSEKLRSSTALVLVGGRGWRDESLRSKLQQARKDGANVIVTGYVTDDERTVLLAEATVFVFPSFYEGYGTPLVEAASLGVPIVASDIPVFHEVIGQGALFAAPSDPAVIATQIERLLTDRVVCKQLLAGQKAILSRLDWSTMARSVLTHITQTVQEGK